MTKARFSQAGLTYTRTKDMSKEAGLLVDAGHQKKIEQDLSNEIGQTRLVKQDPRIAGDARLQNEVDKTSQPVDLDPDAKHWFLQIC